MEGGALCQQTAKSARSGTQDEACGDLHAEAVALEPRRSCGLVIGGSILGVGAQAGEGPKGEQHDAERNEKVFLVHDPKLIWTVHALHASRF